jgi:hypothetical protein
MAGYSETPLLKKLGIKEGQRLCILGAPRGYMTKTLGRLPRGVVKVPLPAGRVDVVHFFTVSRDELAVTFPALREAVVSNGSVWVSWPKKSSGVESDLDGNVVRDLGLLNGMVDVKVCAVDETWSGLKFMFRVKDRRTPER